MRILSALLISSFLLASCGDSSTASTEEVKKEVKKEALDPMQDKGVGPISSVSLSATIDVHLKDSGKILYDNKCTACHKIDKRKIGPAMAGVTKRRTPEWIMNMILNPDQMVKENAQARQLLMEYSAPMANQSLNEEEARAILEYFRSIDS